MTRYSCLIYQFDIHNYFLCLHWTKIYKMSKRLIISKVINSVFQSNVTAVNASYEYENKKQTFTEKNGSS